MQSARLKRADVVRHLLGARYFSDVRRHYILTHTGPTSTLKTINADYRIDEYTDWLEEINKTVDFKHWYFGHFHTDKRIDNKHSVVFNEVSILL